MTRPASRQRIDCIQSPRTRDRRLSERGGHRHVGGSFLLRRGGTPRSAAGLKQRSLPCLFTWEFHSARHTEQVPVRPTCLFFFLYFSSRGLHAGTGPHADGFISGGWRSAARGLGDDSVKKNRASAQRWQNLADSELHDRGRPRATIASSASYGIPTASPGCQAPGPDSVRRRTIRLVPQ